MEEKKQKKSIKHKNNSIIIYIFALILAFFVGREITQMPTNGFMMFNNHIPAFVIIITLVTYVLETIFYEVGKLIFGKICGFRLIYFSLFGFSCRKGKDKKTKSMPHSYENFGGNTVMAPKGEPSSFTTVIYHLGGTIFTVLIYAILAVFVAIFAKNYEDLPILKVYLFSLLISIILLIINVTPILSDTILDGFALRLALESKESKEIYYHNLRQEYNLFTGEGELELKEFDNYEDMLKAQTLIYNYYYYVSKGDYKKAKETVELGLTLKDYYIQDDYEKLISLHYFFLLLNGSNEQIDEEYWKLPKSIRKVCLKHSRYENMKTSLLVSSFIELSYDLYEYMTTKIESSANKYPYDAIVDKENEMVEMALNAIKQKKPEWFVEYKENSEEEK